MSATFTEPIPNTKPLESRDPASEFGDYGRAVEVLTITDEGAVWKPAIIVRTLDGGRAFEIKRASEGELLETATVAAEDLREHQPAIIAMMRACLVCASRAVLLTVKGKQAQQLFYVACETCGSYLTDTEPKQTAPETSPTMFVHKHDDEAGTRKHFFNAMETGELVECDEMYFEEMLDILPVAYISTMFFVGGVNRRIAYTFAEGEMKLVAFWRVRQPGQPVRYRNFCQQTDIMNPLA